MLGLIRVGGLALSVSFSSAALAFGPSIGTNADIGQLNTGFYGSDPASNAPNPDGVWANLVGSNFTFASRPGVRVVRTPHVKITVTP